MARNRSAQDVWAALSALRKTLWSGPPSGAHGIEELLGEVVALALPPRELLEIDSILLGHAYIRAWALELALRENPGLSWVPGASRSKEPLGSKSNLDYLRASVSPKTRLFL